MRLSIIIPCFNEAETIEAVVARVLSAPLPAQWDREVIVVDDGSDTPTKDALKRITTAAHPVRIHYRPENGGKGAAVKDGLRHATGDYIVIQDADLEYNPHEYARLLSPLEENPNISVFGTRSNSDNNVPYSRVYFYGGLLVTQIYNVLFRTQLTDIASCYKVFSVQHVPALIKSSHDDFVFDAVDLTHTLVQAGDIVEVPITYTARNKKTGKKLNWKHGLDIVIAILLQRIGVPPHRLSSAAKVLRFLVAGGTATVVNIAALYILTDLAGIWYLISSAIAFALSFGVSFTMQKYWAFRNNNIEKVRRQLPMHLSLALFNLAVDVLLVYTLVEMFGMWYILAQIVAAAVIAFESFFAFRWIYR